jgi:hypothetical protein
MGLWTPDLPAMPQPVSVSPLGGGRRCLHQLAARPLQHLRQAMSHRRGSVWEARLPMSLRNQNRTCGMVGNTRRITS